MRAVTGPVFDSFFNVSFRMLSETYRAVLVDVSYLAVDALEGEGALVKGDLPGEKESLRASVLG